MKNRSYTLEILTFVVLILLGQLVFLILSNSFTKLRYEGRIFATIGIQHDGESNLHELNEGAHYFGQTIIGWTKFPSFENDLKKVAALPEFAHFNAHMQERQNIIFTLFTLEPINKDQLVQAKLFVEDHINSYNQASNTKFVLTNVDYQLADITRTYGTGAIIALLASGVLALAVLFVRREFFVQA